MKIPQKLAYPLMLSALATTSCASVNLPTPSVPTFGLGKKAQEKRAHKKYIKSLEEMEQQGQQVVPAHLAYTQTNGKMSNEILGQMERTSPINRLKFWSDAYNKNPSDADTSLSFIRSLREIGSQERAIQIATHALVIHPNFVPLMVEQGKALSSLGQTAQAVGVFREILAKQPNSADALAGLGLALERSGNSAEAQNAFQQAINLEPNRIETLSNYGMSLARTGNLPHAIGLLERAFALAPGDSKIQSNYALLMGMAGRYDEMRQINLGIPQELAQKNEAILRELGPKHPQPSYQQAVSAPAPYATGYGTQTPTQPQHAQPQMATRQNANLPYGVNAARAALGPQSPQTQATVVTNPATKSFYAAPSAAPAPQYGATRQQISPAQYAPTPYGHAAPYAPTPYGHTPAQQPSQFPQLQSAPAPVYASTAGGYGSVQTSAYGQIPPYQTHQTQPPSPPPPSGREWGAYPASEPHLGGDTDQNTPARQTSNLTGGYPYSAKSYFQNIDAKPEDALSNTPPPLQGYPY